MGGVILFPPNFITLKLLREISTDFYTECNFSRIDWIVEEEELDYSRLFYMREDWSITLASITEHLLLKLSVVANLVCD